MSDKVTAWLRTVVPAAWGSLILWAVAQIPAIPESVQTWLTSDATVGVVVALSIGAWYWLWRKVENKIPDWLVTIVLGSAKTPNYDSAATVYVSDVTGEDVIHVELPDGTEQHFTA